MIPTQRDESNVREATPDEIRRYEAGEQEVWKCPTCDREIEVLSAVAVICAACRKERRILRWMVKQPKPPETTGQRLMRELHEQGYYPRSSS